jgi:hypothetical protein
MHSTNPKGNQQPRWNKRKGRNNNCKGVNNKNNNQNKDNQNNDKSCNNVGEGKKEMQKVKFPCKLCKKYHLTHVFPRIEEASRLVAQYPVVLTNLFPHTQNMASRTSNTRNALGGVQNPPTQDGFHQCVNMVRSEVSIATRTCDYGPPQPTLGIEPPPSETPLKIDKPLCLMFRKEFLSALLIIQIPKPPKITQFSKIWTKPRM